MIATGVGFRPTAATVYSSSAPFWRRLSPVPTSLQDAPTHSSFEYALLTGRYIGSTAFGPPVPELPVADVERAQQHYRDALGFEIGWLYPGKELGAVSRGEAVIFFRRRNQPFEPAVHWVFAEDIDATYSELRSLGSKIVEPLERKPWGLRQFTVEDLDGNRFYFHCD